MLLPPTAISALIGFTVICVYYFGIWWFLGRQPRRAVVTLYAPPRNLSPAMMRFIWKERFDDRALWACILSLVSKKIAVLQEESGKTLLRAIAKPNAESSLSKDESLLAEALFGRHFGRRNPLSISAPEIAVAIWRMSRYFHEAAIKWFSPNREHLLIGGGLSFAAVAVTASPNSVQEFGALVLAFAAMAPGAYYGFFVLLRIIDFFRALRKHMGGAVLGRAVTLFGLLLPNLAALVLGTIFLRVYFPIAVMPLMIGLVAVNASSLLWLKLPTEEGQVLLGEIEGFRDFLRSVDLVRAIRRPSVSLPRKGGSVRGASLLPGDVGRGAD